MGCSLMIKHSFDLLTSSEKKIGEYILKNPKEIYKLSASELANLTETSSASVVRFSKKLGFDGFQEFKIELAKEDIKEKSQEQEYEYIDTDDSVKDVILKIGKKNIKTIDETLQLIDEDQVEDAINSILVAKNIYLFGVGVSALVAMDLQYKLMRINKNVFMYMDSHMQLSSAARINSEDLAIAISHTGKTKEVYKSLLKAKEKGAKCISITKYGNNPISDISHIKLKIPNVEKDLRVGAISSRIAQLTLIDILFIGVAKNNFEEVEKYLKNTNEMVADQKLK